MKTISILLCLVILSLAALTGCGSKGSKKITISHYVPNTEDKTYFAKLVPEFEKTHPNIKINVITVPYAQFDTKLQTLMASNPPDVTSHYGDGGFIEYLNKDMILDLTPYIKKAGFDSKKTGIPDRLMKIYNINGKQYGIPDSMYVSMLVYNRDALEKAGIGKLPTSYDDKSWTFDKLVDIAKKVTIHGKNPSDTVYGLVWDSWNTPDMNPLYFGAKIFSDDTWTNGGYPLKSYYNSAQSVAAFQRMNELVNKDKVAPTPSVSTALAGTSDMFLVGKANMTATGAWEIAQIKDLNFKVGVAAIPVYGNSTVRDALYVDPLMILKGSKHPEEAFQWIEYLVSKETEEKAIDLAQVPPANELALDKYYQSIKGVDPKDIKAVVEGALKNGTESYNHLVSNYSQIVDIVKNEVNYMEDKNTSAQAAADKIQKKMDDLLATMKKK